MIEFWILYFRLINAISKLYTKLLERKSDINPQSEVLVSDGAYEALFCAIMGNVNPGDEVIIIEPYFDCYEPMVRLAGKHYVHWNPLDYLLFRVVHNKGVQYSRLFLDVFPQLTPTQVGETLSLLSL